MQWGYTGAAKCGYKSDMNLITSTNDLRAICAHAANAPYMCVDTEFMRERTFYPIVCLIQMAIPATSDEPEMQAMIDPMAEGIDLTPFLDLLTNPNVIKVMHGCRQDIEIFYNMAEIIPAPLYDTQIAAMVCGFGDAVGYEALIRRTTGESIDKTNRFTDWAQRPLSDAQLEYALSDVTLLRGAYEALVQQIEEGNRQAWVEEELAKLSDLALYKQEPEQAWKRFKINDRRPRVLGVLIELAAWREREAQKRDVPRGRVLKDDAVRALAMQAPKDEKSLKRMRGLPHGFEKSAFVAPLLKAIERGSQRTEEDLPVLPRPPDNRPGIAPLIELLKVLLKHCADDKRVAPKLLASAADLERIASDEKPDVAAMQGWRHEIFGQYALALKGGHLALASENDKVVLIKRD